MVISQYVHENVEEPYFNFGRNIKICGIKESALIIRLNCDEIPDMKMRLRKGGLKEFLLR